MNPWRNSIPEGDGSIAIVGMSARLPGASNVAQFWRNLRSGVESITFFTPAQAAADGVPGDICSHPDAVFAGGMLQDFDAFDADFFGFSPKEAEIMDPQQRVFLECAWSALEDAGYDSLRCRCKVGVFASVSPSRHFLELSAHPDLIAPLTMYQAVLDNDKDFIASRVSYKLNLTGPAMMVQTACSSSLVAVHTACQSLLNGESDMCLTGGVSVKFLQTPGYVYVPGGVGSPDGHCRAFDANARGMVSGDGVAVVVLKRLADAVADRDQIRAVIRGTAINNDGSGKVGFSAPSVEGQAEAIGLAHQIAAVSSRDIGFVEAHGTGTALGDPIEVAALTRAFSASAGSQQCALGSVKTNIGHLDAAAGIAGLIKTTLALAHAEIPPSLHFSTANPEIPFSKTPFYVNDRLRPFEPLNGARRAGVSSFGIGGTNAHAVLEECERPLREHVPGTYVLPISAKTPAALKRAAHELSTFLKEHPDVPLEDVAFTLSCGRRRFRQRVAVVASNVQEAHERLKDPQYWTETSNDNTDRPVCFLFPGQGNQYAGMAHGLYQLEPFRSEFDRCALLLKRDTNLDLHEILYSTRALDPEELSRTEIAQPLLFTVEYSLAKLWMDRGVSPTALLGHSIGEYVAACLAGVFSLPDALRIVALRGQLVKSMPPGRMLAVPVARAELTSFLNEDVCVAASNGPRMTVLSGTANAVMTLKGTLERAGIESFPLKTSHAFHSHMMTPAVEPFLKVLRGVSLSAPSIPFISNVTGEWIQPHEATDPNYWAIHLRQTVLFPGADASALADRPWVLLEVGPGRSLSKCFEGCNLSDRLSTISALVRGAGDDQAQFARAWARLWLAGADVDVERSFRHLQPHRISLPTYPFEKTRFLADFPWRRRGDATVCAPRSPEVRTEPARGRPTTLASKVAVIDGQLRVMERQMSLLSRARVREVEIPLTPVQQWFFEKLPRSPQHWNQSVIVKMRTPVTAEILRAAVHDLVQAQESLRLRYRPGSDGWRQLVDPRTHSDNLSFLDTASSDLHEVQSEVTRIAAETQQQLNLEHGPLFKAVAVNAHKARKQYLVFVTHHLSTDIHSWQIMLEHFRQALHHNGSGAGERPRRPKTSFSSWARALDRWAQSVEAESESVHWSDSARLDAQLLGQTPTGANTHASEEAVVVEVDAATDQSNVRDSEACLAAAGTALLEWSNRDALTVNLECHGREQICPSVDVLETTGWFTALHPVLFTSKRSQLDACLEAVRNQIRSVAHGGLGYGALRYLNANPTIREALRSQPNPQVSFNFLHTPRHLAKPLPVFDVVELSAGPEQDPGAERRHLIDCTASRVGPKWRFEWRYSRNQFDSRSMLRLVALTRDCLAKTAPRIKATAASALTSNLVAR